MTITEKRVYAALDTLRQYDRAYRVERIAAEAGVSTKTTRQILTRWVMQKRAFMEKLPGQGGPKGYQLRTPSGLIRPS